MAVIIVPTVLTFKLLLPLSTERHHIGSWSLHIRLFLEQKGYSKLLWNIAPYMLIVAVDIERHNVW